MSNNVPEIRFKGITNTWGQRDLGDITYPIGGELSGDVGFIKG